jgi:hypothetical protein
MQVAAVSVCMNPHGVLMRQLHGQRKLLISKDWTDALMVKSRQWWYTDKFRQPNHAAESPEAPLQATLNMIPAYTWYAAQSAAFAFVNENEAFVRERYCAVWRKAAYSALASL